jgi:abhydrolase domain-containing protein 6
MILGRPARFLTAILLQIVVATVAAQDNSGCRRSTLSEEIDGGRIVYNVTGAGPTVLLVHGLFATKEQWNPLACLLADAGYRTIAVDLPGYGESDGYALSAYQLENQVEALHALMARLDIKRFDIAGNSMGGAISAMYARRHAEQVRSLAFVGSPLGVTGWSGPMRDAIHRGINPFIPADADQLDLELHLLFVVPPPLSDGGKQKIVATYAANNLHYVQVWNIVNLYDEVLKRSRPAKISTLIVWGLDDRIYDVSGAKTLQRIVSGSELHRLPHAGHLLHLENASDVAPIYIKFLRAQRAIVRPK